MNKTTLILLCLLFSIGKALAQPVNDNCGGATNIGTLPTPGLCVSGLQNGAVTTLNNQTTVASTSPNPYVYLTACQGGGDMTAFALDTWYAFTATGSTVNVTITGFPGVQMALYSGTCGNLLGRGCSISGTLNATQIIIGQTYYLQISGNTTTATDNNFSIAIDNDIDCNDCLLGSSLTATPAPVNGGYSPGQVVQFCFNVSNYTEVNTNWFHGVQISLGPGWTGVISNPTPANDCPVDPPISGTPFVNEGTGIWRWYPNGVTSATTGIIWPAGFYFDNSNVAGTNAGNNFGDPGNCGWTFCWSLTVAPGCSNGANLNVTVNTTGDGESGSWSNLGCVDDPSTIFSAIELCCEAIATNTGPYCPGATIQLNGTGGGTYSWTGPNGFTSTLPNPTLPATTAASGVYTLSINNGGCIATSTTTVVVNPLPAVNAGNDVSVCQNLSTTLTATGASTYVWSPVITNGIAFVPTATTTYTVTGTSAAGCVNTDQVIVTVNPLPTIVANNVSVCATGTVIVSATGGNTYSWSPSTFLSAATGASVTFTPGITSNYTVTGTNANGCVNTDPVTVTVLANAPINAGADAAICIGATTTLTASGGVSYTWSPATGLSATTGPNVTANPTATTTYTVVGTDASGCVGTDQVVVTVNPLPTVNAGADQTLCAGSTVTLTATGTIAYTWSPVITNGVAFTPVATTTYTATGTSAAGCVNTDAVIVTVNPLPTIVANDVSVCAAGTVSVSATGGSTYTWSPATSLSAASGATVTFTPGVTTTYTVTATDINGCVNTDPVTVTVLANAPINAGADAAICIGASTPLTATGGVTYAWSPATGLSSTSGSSITANPTATTTYTVVGTDANGCTGTDQVVVTVNPLPVVNAGADQTVCAGTSVTLNPTGATTYNWTPTAINGVAFVPTATTTYSVTGTTLGCTATDDVVITVNPLPIVNAGADQTLCEGPNVTLTATGATTYSWTPAVTNGVAFTPTVGATTYTVVGTTNGCTGTDQVLVTVNPLPIVNAGADQSVCQGATVTLTASGASTYTWSPTITNGTAFTPALGTTTYSVTGTTADGCTGTDQAVVTVNPNPTPIIQGPTTYCVGNDPVLSTSTTFNSYSWSSGVLTPTATVTEANNPITVTVTNAFGCSGTSPGFTVTQTSLISTTSTIAICQGQSSVIHGITQTVSGIYSQPFVSIQGCDSVSNVTLVVNPLPTVNAGIDQTVCTGTQTALNATDATTYTWSPAETNGIPFTQAIGSTTYTVTGTSAAGCVNTDQVVITVNPLPTVNAGLDQTICVGQTATLTGAGANTYSWTAPVQNNVAFSPAGTTTYTVTGTDLNGCINTDQVLVTVNPLPTVNAGIDQAICIGQSVTLSGGGATTYTWTAPVQNGVPYAPTATATYTATGTDINGCVNTDQVVVTVNPLPTVNAGNDQAICIGQAVTLSGGGAASYSWTAPVQNGVPFSPTTTTTYTATGTSAAGCVNTDQVVVTVNPLPTVNAGIDQTICIGQTVTLAGAGANSYSWTAPVQNNVAFSPSATTTYTVTGTSLAGCINTDQVLVTVNPLPIVAAGNDVTICVGATVTLSGGGAATYSWTAPVQNGVPFSPTTTATYTVSGTSAAGCINTDQVLVTVNPIPTVTAGNDVTICVGASVTLSGGGATTYSWAPAVNNGIAFTPAVGTTTFTVTGTSAGCTNTDQVVVTVNPLPAISAGADVAVCAGQQVTLNASGATNYSWSGGITNGFAFTPNSTTIYTVTGTSAAGCIATDQVLVTVNPIPNVFAGNDVETCLDQTVVLTGSGAATYTWAPTVTNGVAFTPAAGLTTYTMTGTSAAGCTNTDQVLVTVNPNLNAAFIASVTEGCTPLTVTFTNNTANSFDCVWTMSDGTVLSGCTSVTNTFEQPGCYDISLTVTAANGCVTSLTQPDLICVDANPVASFIPSAWQISELDMNVDFNNTSDNATQYIWNFGDTSPLSSDENPSHDYTGNEIGTYDVTLIAISPAGCTDTAYSTIQIYEEVIFYVPNTFTPDNDTYNPTFKPIFTSGYDPFDYSLYIYDRWGELIFESHNTEIGWDGTYGSKQEIDMVQDGTYTWKIEFKVTKNDERRMQVGHVNIIR